MEFEIEYRQTHFFVTFTGKIDPAVIETAVDSVLSHESWEPGTPILVDERSMNASDISVSGVQIIAGICIRARERFGTSKIAIIVSRDLEFGMNRMWMAFVSNKWDATANVFYSLDEGKEWIL